MPIAKIRTRGRLPHWETKNGIYFVTFRLADSLPKSVIVTIREKLSSDIDANRKMSREVERYLEKARGACYLKLPEIANLVADAMRKFDGDRYRLFAWCIMPNHVHVVFQPHDPFTLDAIVHSWKSFSAQIANKILGRQGQVFWQREYYDHLIQDGDQLARAIRYTYENPTKAELQDWRWLFVSSDWS